VRKRPGILAFVALIPALALAAGVPQVPTASPNGLTIDTRVAILESQVEALQGSLNELRGVPSQLARIEEQIKGLSQRSDSTSSIIQQVSMIVLAAGAGAGARGLFGNRKKE